MKQLRMIEDAKQAGPSPGQLAARSKPPPAFSRLTGFWVPRQFVTNSGVDASRFIADLNEKIRTRGFITFDRQVLAGPVDPIDGMIEVHFDHSENAQPFDVPAACSWGPHQRDYFGLDDPYQMSEDASAYTWANVTVWAIDPYLAGDEQILGVVHGERDHYYFYCPCHYAEVVYTSLISTVWVISGGRLISPVTFGCRRSLWLVPGA